jgi:acyl-CoA thioester hydrolase
MFTHSIQLRVRYAETDKMGYVYYGNYATYFEVARVETMRAFGISYKTLEDDGIMMPVLDYKSKYVRPAKYDDLLTITIFIKSMPTARILFEYEVKNEEGVLLNVAETTLVFVDMKTGKPCVVPQNFKSMLQPFFENE